MSERESVKHNVREWLKLEDPSWTAAWSQRVVNLIPSLDPQLLSPLSLILFSLLPLFLLFFPAWTESRWGDAGPRLSSSGCCFLIPSSFLHIHLSITPGAANLDLPVLSGALQHLKSYGLKAITVQRRPVCGTVLLKCVFWLWFCFLITKKMKTEWKDIFFSELQNRGACYVVTCPWIYYFNVFFPCPCFSINFKLYAGKLYFPEGIKYNHQVQSTASMIHSFM